MRQALLVLVLAFPLLALAQADLYMKDTPVDTGAEPNPDNGAMWVTEDIWVRIAPDPAYLPYPFTEASPPWTPAAHENPEYRDPKYSVPNYVYVRVRNRGNVASTGNERLKLYWAKASTGLNWPAQWVDYKANNCGPMKLYGMEVTKPRKNAATATQAERDVYRDAILAVGSQPQYVFTGGVSYWHKQDEVHQFGPSNRHGTPAFLPWHREYVNRYEVLLQEYEPTLKLLYWDWTTPGTGAPFNYFTSTFMGSASGSIGLPFVPTLSPPAVTRSVGNPNPLPGTPDATVLAPTTYANFDNVEVTPHNGSHTYLGGNSGNMSFVPTAAEDPFFFLLHGNLDRLWSLWQRNNAFTSRLDPTQTYGTLTGNINITTPMAPWNGVGTPIQPWTMAGGYIVSKTPTHHSVVSPPIYDNALLTIPALQPGQAVVIQIPWFPPNPADFACFSDQSHFCLLARVETTNSAPWGMTTPETTSVYNNTKANNNIVWKNVTVVDNFPGALRLTSILIRNPFLEAVRTRLRFAPVVEKEEPDFFGTGKIYVDLTPEIYRRWQDEGGEGTDVKPVDAERGRVAIIGRDAEIVGLRLEPEETVPVRISFELNREYVPRAGTVPKFDLVQIGTPKDENEVVGGQRFELDFRRLVLVPENDEEWRWLDTGAPGEGWRDADYDDSRWKKGRAEFGYADDPETTIDDRVTTYYRRTFDVADPAVYRNLLLHLKRDDGAAVYLNGAEIHRVNLPADAGDDTHASAAVNGVAEEVYFPVDVPLKLLKAGRNAIAVELHQDQKGDDASFDLALSANHAVRDTPPSVAILSPPAGSLFRTGEEVSIIVDAIDPDGAIKGIQLFVDGRLAGTSATAPATFLWPATGAGPHRVRAVALNSEQTRRSEITLNVVENVPPVANLLAPADAASFPAGTPIEARVDASDRDGKVARVEFWIQEGNFFGSTPKLVTSDTTAPFTAALPTDLPPGHYMVWAVAVDDRGEESPSMMVHIAITGEGGHGH
jgi:Common central domain of tyrosinase/Bacterial Ig domain